MMKFIPHNRFRISNRLAVFAAFLLLVSSVVGYEAKLAGNAADTKALPSANVENSQGDRSNVKARSRTREFSPGLLLFRRG